MKYLFLLFFFLFTGQALAGSVIIHNKSETKVTASSIGGRASVEPNEMKSVSFENEEERTVIINIWWNNNPRQLCQVETPFDRTIIVTGKIVLGTLEIQCLSKKVD